MPDPGTEIAATKRCGSAIRQSVSESPFEPRLLPDTVAYCERSSGHRGVHGNDNSAWGRMDTFGSDGAE